jgi:hypothetical protein
MKKPGSTFMEVFIWSTVFIPGPFYSLWRILGKKPVCPKCGGTILKDLDSKVGRAIAERHGLVLGEEIIEPPSAHEEWAKIQEEIKREELSKRETRNESDKQDPKEW